MSAQASPLPSVLLADDDHTIRMLLGQIIASFGCNVTYAENGRLALGEFKAANGNFDLLVTDICMPEMDGRQLIREVRKQRQEMPVIVISGYADKDMVQDIESMGIEMFHKPINFERLQRSIEALLGMHRAG